MTLELVVQQKISRRPDNEELLALWQTVWAAYNAGGRKAVERALDKLCEEIAHNEEKRWTAGA